MTQGEFNDLREGDLVRHKLSGNAYQVVVAHPKYIVIGRFLEMSVPREWDRLDRYGEIANEEDDGES